MFHYVYKTENLVNGKVYVGKHSTKSLENDYLGSGKLLHFAIKKYGRHNFKKTILLICESADAASEMEKCIVTQEFVDDDKTYNLNLGGYGSWHYTHSPEIRAKGIATLRKIVLDPQYRKNISERQKRLYSSGRLHGLNWTGRRHREETKRKIGTASSVHQKGKSNSMYGKVWISNLTLQKDMFISKDEANKLIETGEWIKGRKFMKKRKIVLSS